MEHPRPLPAWMEPGRAGLTRYAAILASVGLERGLIGPREVARLWERHLLNCAVIVDPATGLVSPGSRVADIGSGAGLPGIVWTIVRPDLHVVLLEPLLRRARFLDETIAALGLESRVEVRRARAEQAAQDQDWVLVDVVTARAVAPLGTLLTWMRPLARPDGTLLALKGERAQEEIAAVRADPQVRDSCADLDLRIQRMGTGVVAPETTVVVGRARTAGWAHGNGQANE